MKAKLIKDSDGYWLDISDDGITKRPLTDFGQLSIKNCEAIANGYDLDDMSSKKYTIENTGAMFMPNRHEVTNIYKQEGFIEGAKAILEILGDKKFSEEDMIIFSDKVHVLMNQGKVFEGISEVIQSLQQTEWDVEVIMKSENMRYDGGKQIEYDIVPKLDSEGCLILKRI